jgi:hypothetical protein
MFSGPQRPAQVPVSHPPMMTVVTVIVKAAADDIGHADRARGPGAVRSTPTGNDLVRFTTTFNDLACAS